MLRCQETRRRLEALRDRSLSAYEGDMRPGSLAVCPLRLMLLRLEPPFASATQAQKQRLHWKQTSAQSDVVAANTHPRRPASMDSMYRHNDDLVLTVHTELLMYVREHFFAIGAVCDHVGRDAGRRLQLDNIGHEGLPGSKA